MSTPETPLLERLCRSLAFHGLAYPFTVLEDKNPKGRAWLLSVLAQAQRPGMLYFWPLPHSIR